MHKFNNPTIAVKLNTSLNPNQPYRHIIAVGKVPNDNHNYYLHATKGWRRECGARA